MENSKLKSKPFSSGMYAFLMFLIDYYRRVRSDLKIDYDSFIIIQVVVSHGIYLIQSEHSNYSEIAIFKNIQVLIILIFRYSF